MLDIVGKRYWFFALSGLIIIPGLISLLLFGMKPGIDFSSGSILTLRFAGDVEQGQLRQAFADLGHADAIVQRSGGNVFVVRTRALATQAAQPAPVAQPGQAVPPEQAGPTTEREQLINALSERFGQVEVVSFDSVSPLIAAELVGNATLAVTMASLGILAYITFAFRRLARSFRYGACAVIALVHDVLVVLGIYSILGRVFGLEVDAMFITAVLTVIGFSVHDTIVVFDRIRENLQRYPGERFTDVVNHSVLQTLDRSINTTLTVVLTLVALLLFGGVTIRNFVLVLLIGIVSGTYSSIFNASMLLVVWELGELRRLFAGRRAREVKVAG